MSVLCMGHAVCVFRFFSGGRGSSEGQLDEYIMFRIYEIYLILLIIHVHVILVGYERHSYLCETIIGLLKSFLFSPSALVSLFVFFGFHPPSSELKKVCYCFRYRLLCNHF